jgi:predicted Zn finger-like uncharacterized protein
MIEIQCTSCQTRYRIDERILPEDTPTFKCSRCGHVFSAEPRQKPPRRPSAASARAAGAAAAKAAPSSSDTASEPPSSASPPPQADSAARAAAPAAESTPEKSTPSQPPPEPPSAAEGASADAFAQPIRVATRQPARVAPRPQAEKKPASPSHGTSELLERRFRDLASDEAEKPGENLSFDFNDEPRAPDSSVDSYAEEKWEVGDTDVPPSSPPRPKSRIRISDIDDGLDGEPALERDFGRTQTDDRTLEGGEEQEFDRIRPEEVSEQAHRLEAELRGRSYKIHSAGYFIGLFALVILGFGIVTIAIQSAPVASAGLLSALPIVGQGLEPPISAARRVALSQVQAQYASLKGNQTALVISGTAENLTASPLGAVQVEAALTAAATQPLRSQAVYCGNSLSEKMLGEMTPHEIEFFEKLDAPKSFTLAPQASAPFVIVFIEPPAGAVHFELRVVRADPAAPPAPAPEGS